MKVSTQDTIPAQASLLQLFATFFKIGAFTFGGGWAMISIIEREVVVKRHWLSKEAFLDLLSVAQALPGILAVNIAVAIGDNLRRRPGAIISALGAILPSFSMILVIAVFLTPQMIKDSPVIDAVFKGIRPAVVALIIAPVITTARTVGITWRTIAIPVAVALLVWSHWPFVSNPILYIIIGGAVGYLIERHRRKEGTRS